MLWCPENGGFSRNEYKKNINSVRSKALKKNLPQSRDCMLIIQLYAPSGISLQRLTYSLRVCHFPIMCRTHLLVCFDGCSIEDRTVGHRPF